MAKSKIPSRSPSSGRRLQVHADAAESPQHQPPLFSLRHLRRDFSLSDCTQEEKAAFADTLHKLSQMTWAEINTAPRHGSGHEIISRDAIKSSIPDHITEDVNLLAFRFHGKAPMIGYRDGAIFYVVWIDPHFKLYDH